MNDVANKLALIACEQCKRYQDESDIDFSTRLLSVYNSCYDNICDIISEKNRERTNQSVSDFLTSNHFS